MLIKTEYTVIFNIYIYVRIYIYIYTSHPWELISIDILVNLPTMKRGNHL